MSCHALVVDDDPDIVDDVKDRLEGMGHTCETVNCQVDARHCLKTKYYSYVLLDLEIPVRYGRPARIPNGQNLLAEIRQMKELNGLPVIVMTAYGQDGPDLAVEVMRDGLATDFVNKPFPSSGENTFEQRIRRALEKAGRLRPEAARRVRGSGQAPEPMRFEVGEMVFYATRVELEGVKICGEPDSRRRKILNELRRRDARNRFVAYSGEELAEKVGCRDRGQNGVAEAVRDFRKHVTEILRDEANIIVGPRDVIESGGRGYRFTEKITVRDVDDSASGPRPDRGHDPDDPENDTVNDPDGRSLNERQEWVLEQLEAGKQVRIGDLMEQFPCSKTTAKRDLADLRQRGLVEFDGCARTGFWRAKDERQAESRRR